MKAHIASDIHFEFMSPAQEYDFWARFEDKVAADAPDILILAGDIGSTRPEGQEDLLRNLERFGRLNKQTVYVPGNHEFFGTTISEGTSFLSDTVIRGVSDVNPVRAVLAGDVDDSNLVTGGTMWYPDCGDPAHKSTFADYRFIADAEPMIEKQYQAFIKHSPGDIVVTHHMPTEESISPQWQGSTHNNFFCADIDETIEMWNATNKVSKLWVHGHTHDPKDFVSRHGFRVYCNPLGYVGEGSNPDFFDRLLVDI